MKPGRQSIILEIISKQSIGTQNQLLEALAERGIKSTQATLSRDMKDMRLIKETGPDGVVRYVKPPEADDRSNSSRLHKILKESVLSFDLAQNILVMKTLSGLASGACSRGILFCGTGVGIGIAANKIRGIRCVTCTEPYSAKLSRRHNDANMLAKNP